MADTDLDHLCAELREARESLFKAAEMRRPGVISPQEESAWQSFLQVKERFDAALAARRIG